MSEQKNHNMPSELAVADDVLLKMITKENVSDLTPEINKYINLNPDIRSTMHFIKMFLTKDEIKKNFTSDTNQGKFQYAMTQNESLIGLIGLSHREESDLGSEIVLGYSLDPKFRRRGLVSLSLNALIEEATLSLRPDYFTLYISDSKERSKSVAKRNNFFKTEGTEGLYETDSGAIERRYLRKSV